MAIPKEFTESIATPRGLKANKNYTKFYYRFKIEGREFTKKIDYSKKQWDKSDRKKYAIAEAIQFKDDKTTELLNPFNPDTTVDFIADAYFTKKCGVTKWHKERRRLYELHIQPYIGKKKASLIREHDIDSITTEMREESIPNYSPKKVGAVAKSLSDRTVEKIILQILTPILKYAVSNGAMEKLPTINTGSTTKQRQRKKKVKDGSKKLALLHKAIMSRYADDAYYRTLFLFALNGRRWNEIKTLTWECINLEDNTYTIYAEHNKIGEDQEYALPPIVRKSLLQINDNRTGLVFKPHRGGEELYPPKKQLEKLKRDTGIQDLTMHYFRHIFVTALGELGTEATVMSAALGHTDSRTLEKHYLTINHTISSGKANAKMEQILNVAETSAPKTKTMQPSNKAKNILDGEIIEPTKSKTDIKLEALKKEQAKLFKQFDDILNVVDVGVIDE